MKATYPIDNYMFKFNDRNTRKRCEICSKLIIKTPERPCSRTTLFLFTPCSSVAIAIFEHVIADWVCVCVCLRAHHLDVVRLGVKVD